MLVLRLCGNVPEPGPVTPMPGGDAIRGAARLSIKHDELDGTLSTYGVGAPSAFVLFDTVPGGARHAQRVGREIAEIAQAALERVERCECGPETSCYQCLRSYQNQSWHEELVRGAATGVLRDILGVQAP